MVNFLCFLGGGEAKEVKNMFYHIYTYIYGTHISTSSFWDHV